MVGSAVDWRVDGVCVVVNDGCVADDDTTIVVVVVVVVVVDGVDVVDESDRLVVVVVCGDVDNRDASSPDDTDVEVMFGEHIVDVFGVRFSSDTFLIFLN